jgi:hypothetical protein
VHRIDLVSYRARVSKHRECAFMLPERSFIITRPPLLLGDLLHQVPLLGRKLRAPLPTYTTCRHDVTFTISRRYRAPRQVRRPDCNGLLRLLPGLTCRVDSRSDVLSDMSCAFFSCRQPQSASKGVRPPLEQAHP